ncbi:MAG: hypothetical protein JEZ11_17420, partial [Desulfobacterales bacterium]|nr:hypothetical protein [Desulfobacterales bacterium]
MKKSFLIRIVFFVLVASLYLTAPVSASAPPGPDDLAQTMECSWRTIPDPENPGGDPINDPEDELVALAAELDHDPVKITNWVYEEIESHYRYGNYWIVPYFKARLDARTVYRTRRGNHWDTSTLLVTLLRISGIPARYVKFDDYDYVYVLAWVPHDNYRGANGGAQKGWVPLAPWFKDKEYEDGIDLFQDETIPSNLDYDFDDYLQSDKQQSALELYQGVLQNHVKQNHPGKTITDIPWKDYQVKGPSSILPSSLPSLINYPSNTTEYSEIPDTSRVNVDIKFYIYDGDGNPANDVLLLEKTVYLTQIAGKRFCLDFVSAGGTDLKPVLTIDGEIIAGDTGSDPAISNSQSFYFKYKGTFETKYRERPSKEAGTFMVMAFDQHAASGKMVEQLKTELEDLASTDAYSSATREGYLGRVGTILSTSFLHRKFRAIKKSTELLHGCFQWFVPSATFIYTDPTSIVEADDAKYFIRAMWNIDSMTGAGKFFKLNENGVLIDLEWDNPKFQLARNLFMYSDSINEGRIFEDWQNTPGASTIKGLMLANELVGGESVGTVELTSNNVVMQNGDWHIPDLENDVPAIDNHPNNGGKIAYSIIRNVIVKEFLDDTGALVPDGQVKIQMPRRRIAYEGLTFYCYIINSPAGDGYMFGQDNGGAVTFAYDQDTPTVTISLLDQFSADSPGISIVDAYSVSLASGSILGSPYEFQVDLNGDGTVEPSFGFFKQISALAEKYSLGDPVNMVTGEFYQEENPDFVIKSIGFDLSLKRTYLSRAVYNGPFGYGWTFNHGEQLILLDKDENGSVDDIIYYNSEIDQYYLTSNGDGTYQYPPGTTFVLTSSGGQYIVTQKHGGKQFFNAQGYLVRKEDTNGNYLTFEYDAENRMTAIRDSLNRALTFTYNANDKVARVTDFTGRYCDYGYDGDDLVSFTDLEGNTTQYEYLSGQENPLNDHNMSKYILPNGDYLEIGYYKNDQVSYHRNKLGQTFNFQYSRLNRYGETWNEAGYYRKVFFNESNDVTRVDNEDGTLETKTWDANHNMLTHTDANGHATTYTYDGRRNVLTKTNGLNQQWTYTYHATFNKVATETDPKGYVTTYTYDTSGNLTSKTDPAGKETEYTYDSHGNLTVATDPLNYTVTSTFDAQGLHVETVTDKNGNETGFIYDNVGRIATVTDPEGFATEFIYNGYDQKTRVTDALFNETAFEYDVNRKPLKRIDPSGAVTILGYHPARDIVAGAKVFKKTDALGNSEFYDYDELGNLIRKEDRNGNATTYAYDQMSRLIEETDAFNNTVRYTYDGNGNLTSKTDRRGGKTTFTFDAANRKTAVTDAEGNTTTYAYDANGNLTDETNAIGMVTHYTYDNRNLLTAKTAGYGTPEALVTAYSYDDLGRKVRETRPLGNYTVFDYDGNGNQTRVATYSRYNNLLNETRFDYDGRNLLTQKTDAEGNEFTYEYDDLGRKIAETDPRGNRTEFFYDAMGNLVSLTDDLGNATRHTYDLNNRRVKTENALGYVTGYRYDNVGNHLAVFDAMGQRTNFWYDAVNRKIGRQDPAGGTTVFDYDENGNLTGTTDPAGSTTLYAYDANNRRTSERRVLADSSEAETVTQYDELGRIETVIDRTGTETEFDYDDILNVKTGVTKALGTADEVSTIFDYDANGRLIAKTDAYGTTDEAATQYQYDDADNLTAITNANGETVTYTYDLLGRRLREYDADGSYLRAEYDGAGNMTLVVKRDGTQIVSTYDDLNRKTAVTVNSTLAQSFAFDALSRMVEAVDRNQGRAANTAAWEYDALSRVTAEVQNGLRVEKGYDANSNLEVLAYPGFKVVERTFNADNTLSQVWDGTGPIAT